MPNPHAIKRARTSIVDDAVTRSFKTDDLPPPRRKSLTAPAIPDIEQYIQSFVDKCRESHPKLHAQIKNTIRKLDHVTSFQGYNEIIVYLLKSIHPPMDEFEKTRLSSRVKNYILAVLERIVAQCGPFAKSETRYNGLPTLLQIARSFIDFGFSADRIWTGTRFFDGVLDGLSRSLLSTIEGLSFYDREKIYRGLDSGRLYTQLKRLCSDCGPRSMSAFVVFHQARHELTRGIGKRDISEDFGPYDRKRIESSRRIDTDEYGNFFPQYSEVEKIQNIVTGSGKVLGKTI
ncbi:uncharacterized protein BO97DRAFT_453364 [Aspergillus homomorphus CBS 101889]|uniref:Uncharacterized protein n=1 Tax=Aspergillus homomorphus (strain CBS 101889) TaxID=1450537 RepID=A0A395HVF9_ASPHC|nr:hypothetical protein BO97DRAFT_453364 [Aspergillus homomorphus CBS 101889]RAL11797.1 hypothetical protein BO97DRAFT_453364 [Aspergillus homomorphus CBS 101889]